MIFYGIIFIRGGVRGRLKIVVHLNSTVLTAALNHNFLRQPLAQHITFAIQRDNQLTVIVGYDLHAVAHSQTH